MNPTPSHASTQTPIRGVVFDLDGTLIDSWQIHERCLREAVLRHTGNAVGTVRIFRAQRPTDLETLGELVGHDRADEVLLTYRAALSAALADVRPRPVAGAPEVLAGLRDLGVAVGVCTGRSREDARALLDAGGLSVPVTVARQDAPPKPAPDALLLALRRLSLTPGEALFVGDSEWDRAQGRAAGVRTLIVGPGGLPGGLAQAQWPDGVAGAPGSARPDSTTNAE